MWICGRGHGASLAKVLVLWTLLTQGQEGLGAPALGDALRTTPAATPPLDAALTPAPATSERDGSSEDIPHEGIRRTARRAIVKRSTGSPDGYLAAVGYDPASAFGKKSDPGYESYMQSIGYDPMSAWGKRDTGYDSYMQSIGYDPMAALGKRDPDYESYLQSIGYNPMATFAKRKVKRRTSDTPFEAYQQQLADDRTKKEEYADGYYPEQYYEENEKKLDSNDQFMDVYMPQHFMHSFKRSLSPYFLSLASASNDWKRAPNDMGAQGFHEGIFTHNFGDFSPVKRSKREVGDSHSIDLPNMKKRRMGMGASGFHGDTFSQGFGDFSTMKKRRMGMGASGFHGDTFSQGFGDFSTMKKRRMGMGASGFHGDTFSQGFGDFSTMKKRRMGMGASGFHGDTFSQGFGDFSTMKKRRMGMGASGFHGDTFSQGFGDFSTMKKRRMGSGASGFHGDTFSQGFGDFSTMKKRRMGMGASGFHGDTFSQGFGDFSTMKKRPDMSSSEKLAKVYEDIPLDTTSPGERVEVIEEKEKDTTRTKRNAEDTDDSSLPWIDADVDYSDQLQMAHGEDKENTRFRRNLEDTDTLKVELHQPKEINLVGRRQRSVWDAEGAGEESGNDDSAPQTADAPKQTSRNYYDQNFSEGLGDSDSMKSKR